MKKTVCNYDTKNLTLPAAIFFVMELKARVIPFVLCERGFESIGFWV
jgi:hypothetical protein